MQNSAFLFIILVLLAVNLNFSQAQDFPSIPQFNPQNFEHDVNQLQQAFNSTLQNFLMKQVLKQAVKQQIDINNPHDVQALTNLAVQILNSQAPSDKQLSLEQVQKIKQEIGTLVEKNKEILSNQNATLEETVSSIAEKLVEELINFQQDSNPQQLTEQSPQTISQPLKLNQIVSQTQTLSNILDSFKNIYQTATNVAKNFENQQQSSQASPSNNLYSTSTVASTEPSGVWWPTAENEQFQFDTSSSFANSSSTSEDFDFSKMFQNNFRKKHGRNRGRNHTHRNRDNNTFYEFVNESFVQSQEQDFQDNMKNIMQTAVENLTQAENQQLSQFLSNFSANFSSMNEVLGELQTILNNEVVQEELQQYASAIHEDMKNNNYNYSELEENFYEHPQNFSEYENFNEYLTETTSQSYDSNGNIINSNFDAEDETNSEDEDDDENEDDEKEDYQLDEKDESMSSYNELDQMYEEQQKKNYNENDKLSQDIEAEFSDDTIQKKPKLKHLFGKLVIFGVVGIFAIIILILCYRRYKRYKLSRGYQQGGYVTQTNQIRV